jgi:hypothetical protein
VARATSAFQKSVSSVVNSREIIDARGTFRGTAVTPKTHTRHRHRTHPNLHHAYQLPAPPEPTAEAHSDVLKMCGGKISYSWDSASKYVGMGENQVSINSPNLLAATACQRWGRISPVAP